MCQLRITHAATPLAHPVSHQFISTYKQKQQQKQDSFG